MYDSTREISCLLKWHIVYSSRNALVHFAVSDSEEKEAECEENTGSHSPIIHFDVNESDMALASIPGNISQNGPSLGGFHIDHDTFLCLQNQ